MAVAKEKATETNNEKMVKIRIPKSHDGSGKYQFVGVNGKAYKIEKGVEVEVPEMVAYVLQLSYDAQNDADEYNESLTK